MAKEIERHWKKNSVMQEMPQFKGNVLTVGEGEVRCPYCNRLFFKGTLGSDTEIEVKCTRRLCGQKIRINKI